MFRGQKSTLFWGVSKGPSAKFGYDRKLGICDLSVSPLPTTLFPFSEFLHFVLVPTSHVILSRATQ